MSLETTTVVGLLAAASDTVTASVAGYGTAGIKVSGTFTGTITFQGSVDGAQWDTLTVSTFAAVTATTATAAGQWTVSCAALAGVRCKMTSYTSGTADITIRATP